MGCRGCEIDGDWYESEAGEDKQVCCCCFGEYHSCSSMVGWDVGLIPVFRTWCSETRTPLVARVSLY